ncbi:hypothetical protein AOQ84DRAFT_14446 [Glonium stellatum]|uniref:Uncharacterized protein n=1 Tax=Glonium stellatum TaxID=574774 RepID=A0A8E2F3C6_9PEZI|nr:hypothetical protein AOQ84DRAFT_14446 [Glonium stellatum]
MFVLVDEAGTYGKNQKPQEQPTAIISRSISRSTKPPSLRLTASNGSTAASSTSTSSSSSTITPSYQDRPLPGLPPPPPEKSHLRPEMGSKSSKALDEKDQKPQSPKNLFKRRPLPSSRPNGSKPNLTLADTISSSLKPKKNLAAIVVKAQANSGNASSPSASVPSSRTQAQSDSTELSEETTPSNLTSQERSSTRGTTVEIETPPTPELKPVLLPSPSPVPEESPSKYGIRKPASISSTETRNPPPASSKHFRGKSSTGFDIFKVRTETRTRTRTCNPLSLLSVVYEAAYVRLSTPMLLFVAAQADEELAGHHRNATKRVCVPEHDHAFTDTIPYRDAEDSPRPAGQ